MQEQGRGALSPEAGWEAIHATMEQGRSSMYLAGSATILLLWGVIVALGYFSQYAVETFAPGFAAERPWYPGPTWCVLVLVGMAGSSTIGHRAGRRISTGAAARSVGIRVFFYWLAVIAATFVITAGAGLWSAESADKILGVTIGVVALGYVLFGIMHRWVIAAVGAGIAAAFYIPSQFAGDAALAVSAAATLAVAAIGAAWVRKSGVL